jgi:hypothetical protein
VHAPMVVEPWQRGTAANGQRHELLCCSRGRRGGECCPPGPGVGGGRAATRGPGALGDGGGAGRRAAQGP